MNKDPNYFYNKAYKRTIFRNKINNRLNIQFINAIIISNKGGMVEWGKNI